ncbi:MAG: hypothetical protein N2510_02060, partial [Ignavibacteria bacterium]|nr:hypothetical protein [Ignavibacteria bacterium]
SAKDILTANSFKLTTILESLKQNLIKEKEDFKKIIQNLQNESQKTLKNGEYLFDKYKEEYISTSNLQFIKLETQLLTKTYEGIDNNWDEKIIEQELQKIADKLKKDLETIFNNIYYQFEKDFKKLANEFDNRLLLNLRYSFDYNSSLKNLLKDLPTGYMSELVLIGSFGLFLFEIIKIKVKLINLPVLLISLLITAWNYFIDHFRSEEKKKQKKKDKARKDIKEDISEKKEEVITKINKSFEEEKNAFNTRLNGSIDDLGNDFAVLDKKIGEFIKLISNYSDKINNINKY